MAVQRPGRLLIDALYSGPRVQYVFNPVKDRREIWQRCASGDREWVLFDAVPARMFEEDFIGAPQFVPAILGVELDHAWDTNGDPAPVAGNFVAANEIGGGLYLRGLGAGIDDWVALQMGGNYPVSVAQSPHLHIALGAPTATSLHTLVGLVGADNLETGDGNPWTVPDDGLWLEYDSSVDTNLRFVTRAGGVPTTTVVGALPTGHIACYISVNDAANQAEVIVDGTIVATHTTHLPTAQLKVLCLTRTRAAAQRDLHLHDLRLIFDAGVI